jgi:hypothetical protein
MCNQIEMVAFVETRASLRGRISKTHAPKAKHSSTTMLLWMLLPMVQDLFAPILLAGPVVKILIAEYWCVIAHLLKTCAMKYLYQEAITFSPKLSG